MKKILSTFLLVLLCWTTAWADNIIKVSSTQGHPGDEVLVSVNLDNTDTPTGVELRFELPDALQYVDGSAVLQTERSKDHTLSAAVRDGRLHIVVFSPSLAPLPGSSGELCNFRLKLKKEPGDYTLSPVAVLSATNGTRLNAVVESGVVTLLSPKIEVVTPTIDFGHIPIRSSYTKYISVRNVGNEPLEISGVTTDRVDLTAAKQSYTIAPGYTEQVQMNYAPMVRGAITSKVNFTTNAINPKAGVATVVADPFSVNELRVQRAEGISDEEVTVVLKMNNMEPIAGAQINFQLPEQLVYVDGSAAVGTRCADTGHKVKASLQNGKLALLLYSSNNQTIPEGDGDLMTFRVCLNGPSGMYRMNPTKVVLSNVTMENMVSASYGEYVVIQSPTFGGANELDMGSGAVTEQQTVQYTISNNGKVDLVINKVTFLAEGYSIQEELPLTIKPWQSQTITVAYAPKQEGEHKTTMQIYTNDPNNRMHSVAVKGNIYEPNAITVSGENTKTGYRFNFGLNNYTDIVAVQMRLSWLPGMKTAMEKLLATDRIKNHSYLLSEMEPGVYQVIIYSMNNTPIAGNEGGLFSIDYTAENGVEYRDTELKVTKVVLSDAKGKNYTSEKEVTGKALFTHFTLRFKVDENIISEQWLKVGDKFAIPEVADKTGYSFAWIGLPETMPTEDVEVVGQYTVNNYKLTYLVDAETYKTTEVEYGAEIIPVEAPTKVGYTFAGWETLPKTMPAEDVTVKAVWKVNQYTITFDTDGGTAVDSLRQDYATEITTPADPTKNGYTFVGWDKEIPTTMPAEDMVIKAMWKINQYTITYLVDGKEYDTVNVDYNSNIVLIDAPTKEGYTFSGWSEAPSTMPAEDVVVEGSFSINSYTLNYKVDGEVVDSFMVEYNSAITAIAEPTKEGYTFSGWKNVPATMPASDVVVEGKFSVNQYTITFDSDGGTDVAAITQDYATDVTAPAAPTKTGYTFVGWDKDVPTIMPAENVTIKAQWKINQYTITYLVDGKEYETVSVDYNSNVVPIDAPTKEGCTFSGWKGLPETMPAKDVIVTGSFVTNGYNLTYVVDGKVYKTIVYEYGATITAEVAPTKEGHTFSGWSEVPATMPAKDVVVEGSFTVNSYTLTYKVDGEVVETSSVEYGTAITALDEPMKEGHTFSGWTEVPATMPAKDVVVEGSFTVNSYTLTYKVDGEVVETSSVEYGSAITALAEPTKEGHTFSGWSEVPATMPAKDVVVEGSFTVNSYTVTFILDGEVFETVTVEYGAEIELPEVPEKEGFEFSGWKDVPTTMPAKHIVIEGCYQVPVGINGAELDLTKNYVYNLNGQRILDNKELKRNIYIVNGKKVYVK